MTFFRRSKLATGSKNFFFVSGKYKAEKVRGGGGGVMIDEYVLR